MIINRQPAAVKQGSETMEAKKNKGDGHQPRLQNRTRQTQAAICPNCWRAGWHERKCVNRIPLVVS